MLACAGRVGTFLVDVSNGEIRTVREVRPGNSASTVAYSPDGKTLALGLNWCGTDFHVYLADVATGKDLQPELHEPGGKYDRPLNLALSADGKVLATFEKTQTFYGRIKTWDPATGKLLREMDGRRNASMAISPDGKVLASCTLTDEKYLTWWILLRDLATGQVIRKWPFSTGDEWVSTVTSLVFSPDGKILAAAGPKDGILWDTATGKEWRRLKGHEKPVLALAFSTDGKSLLTSSADHSLRVWESESGKELRRLTGHPADSTVTGIAFSRDGKLIASSGTDNLLCLWEADSGRLLHKIVRNTDSSGWLGDVAISWLGVLAFSPDGKTVVSANGWKELGLWDTATGTLTKNVSGHRAGVTAAIFTPDGNNLITASCDGTALVWDLAHRPAEPPKSAVLAPRPDRNGDPLPAGAVARLGSLGVNHGVKQFGRTFSAVFSADGKMLATMLAANEDRSIRLWDVASGKEIRRFEPGNDWPRSVAFSPDGRLLAYSTLQTIWLFDVATGKHLGKVGDSRKIGLNCFAFSPDGKIIAAGRGDQRPDSDDGIHLYDLATGAKLKHFVGQESPVVSVRFSPDGKFIHSIGSVFARGDGRRPNVVNGETLFWDVTTGKRIESLPDNRDPFKVFGISKIKIVTEQREKMSLRNLNDRELHVLDAIDADWIVSPDCKILATSDKTRGIRLWDIAAGKEIRRFEGFQCPDTQLLGFSPDGKVLASVANKIRFWNVATGRELSSSAGHEAAVSCLAFSADGQLLVSGGEDRSVRLWETSDGKPLRSVTVDHAITALALSPDGKRVAAGDAGNTVTVWETAELRRTARYQLPIVARYPHGVRIGAIAFSPDGKILLAASAQGQLVSWDLENGKQLREHQLSTSAYAYFPFGFSPDCKLAAYADGNSRFGESIIGIWSLTAQKQRCQMKGEKGESFSRMQFSPDGKLVGGCRCIVEEFHGHLMDHQVRIWEAATGQEVLSIDTGGQVKALVFSPDGKVLITGSGQSWDGGDPRIHFWDLSTGKEIGRQPGHVGVVTALAFSPNGKRFASGSADTTILIWDRAVIGQARQPWKTAFPTRQPEEWLAELTGDDALKAYKAQWTMASMPEPSVALLTKRLRPVPQPDDRKIKQWIAELDSKQFEVRQTASAELEKLVELAGPALTDALAKQPPLEVRRRLEQLLERLEIASPDKDQLLAIRATSLLERIGTTEARQLLRRLAEGAKGARLTEQAKAALERLNNRPVQEP